MCGQLNKSNGIPLYMQLKDIIAERIKDGTYDSGELLPSETQLAHTYMIARQTARRAVAELVKEGLVRTEHGKGSFVSVNEVHYSIWNFNGFTDYIRSLGKTPVTRVIEHVVEGDMLKLVRARGVVETDSWKFLTLDTSYIPLKLFPGIEDYDFSVTSLYSTMRGVYHLHPRRIEMSVRAVMSDPVAQKQFLLHTSVPLLNVSGEVFSENSRVVERVSVFYSPKLDFKMMTTINP
jgi:DNA-binding GntR family transcriptional regulator